MRPTGLDLYDAAASAGAGTVIRRYSTSFGLASRLLSRRIRPRIADVYALVRVADEIVDGPAEQAGFDAAQRRSELDALEARTERALQRAGTEEHALVQCGAAERGGECESDQPDHQCSTTPPQVGDATTEEQQSAECQRIRGDDPLLIGRADAEVDLGVGQGDLDHRAVEHDHQLRDADEDQGLPPARVGLGGQSRLFGSWRPRRWLLGS